MDDDDDGMHDTDPSPGKSEREPSITLRSVIMVSHSNTVPSDTENPADNPYNTALLSSALRSIIECLCGCLTLVTMPAPDNKSDKPKMSLYARVAKDPHCESESHSVPLTYAI